MIQGAGNSIADHYRQREMAEKQAAWARDQDYAKNAYPGAILGGMGLGLGMAAGHDQIARDESPRLGSGIEFQMERLAKNVAAMEERFHNLTMKLGPLTRPLPEPAVTKDTGRVQASQSPLADQVARLTDQIEHLNNGMAYLTDGVDL
jgi:hypothetical protein